MINTVPWFGELPAKWKQQRIKTLFTLHDERNYLPLNEVNLLSLYAGKGVMQHANIKHTTGNKAVNADGYKIVAKDDVIVNILLCWMGAIGRSDYDGVTSPAYDVYTPNEGVCSHYYHYLMRTPMFSGECYKVGRGIMSMRWRTYSPQFCNIIVPVPPRSEQDQIVRYLDWQVSKINKLIAAKKKEISLIEECLRCAISKAITRGLNEHAELKDSGISWMGQIPATWNAIKIKWLFSEANERNSDGTAELLTFSRKKGLIPFSEASDKAPSASDLTNYRRVSPGQLLENRMQAWSGMFICVDKNGCVSPDYSVFNPSIDRYVNVKFYEYVFRNPLQVEQFANASRGMGTGFNRLYTPAFGAIYTVYPPAKEQDEIAEYIDELKANYSETVGCLETEIECLQELRNKLISDVVTGQIDVRGIEVPDFEYVENIDESFDDEDSEEMSDDEEV